MNHKIFEGTWDDVSKKAASTEGHARVRLEVLTTGTGKTPLSSKQAIKRVKELGSVTKGNGAELRQKKLEALWALSDAAVAEGMEVWGLERVNQEVAELRGQTEPPCKTSSF